MYETYRYLFLGAYFGAFGAFGGLIAQWDYQRWERSTWSEDRRFATRDWTFRCCTNYIVRALKAGAGAGTLAIAANEFTGWVARVSQ